MMDIKKLWSRFLVWIGLRKQPIDETPIDRSFVIMGLGDLKNERWDKDNTILPSDNKNRMFPAKDLNNSYIGQTIPNPWQPEAKLKHHYYNPETGATRYLTEEQDQEMYSKDKMIPWDFLTLCDVSNEFSYHKLKSMKAELDKADILVRLESAKAHYQNVELLDAAIEEIKLLRQGKCGKHDPVKNGGRI